MEMINKDTRLKKIRSTINHNLKVTYDQSEKDEAIFASDTHLYRYNYQTGFVTEKCKISESKILKFFLLDTLTGKSVFFLNKENYFIEFDWVKKQEVRRIKLINENKENNKSQSDKAYFNNFVYSSFFESFIILSHTGEILYLKNKGDFKIDKRIHLIEENKGQSNSQTFIPFFKINSEGKILLLSYKTKLILHNLITSDSKTIEFQKPLSSGIFLNEDRAVVGDFSGKLHFISNLREKKHLISTKHWHSHKVSAIETDIHSEYLYTAGEEGVIVIWNLKTEAKSFLPRLSTEIRTLSLSPDNQILCLNCKDQSLKFVNLFNFTVINEYSGLCLKKISNKEMQSTDLKTNALSDQIKPFSVKNENFLLIYNPLTGKIQIMNMTNGKILSTSSLMFKNFTSQTEKENINYRKLLHVEINKPDLDYLVTYEEINDPQDPNFLISFLKFWKVNNLKENFSIDLQFIAENPHSNEKIKSVQFLNGKCVTVGEKSFKIWEMPTMDEERTGTENIQCSFVGSYRDEELSAVAMLNNSENLISLHKGKFLVEWNLENREISRIYIFDKEEDSEQWQISSQSNLNDVILLNNGKELISFSLLNFEQIFVENFEKYTIMKNSVGFDTKGKAWLILQNDEIKSEFMDYSIDVKSRGTSTTSNYEVEECTILKKNNVIYINHWKNYNSVIVINNNLEILVTKKISLLGNKFSDREKEAIKDGDDISDISYNPKNKNKV
jgi:hypothetical protein